MTFRKWRRKAVLRLPAIYDFPEMAEEGGFAAYGPRLGQFFVKVMPQQIVTRHRPRMLKEPGR
jgi:hypothetical protein